MNPTAGCRQMVGSASLPLTSPTTAAAKVDAPAWCPSRPNSARPIKLPPLIGAPSKAIRELAKRVCAIYLLDDSGSMYGSYGDPTGIRYAAARSLITLQRRSGGGRAGVVHWGTEAPEGLVTPLIEVKRGVRSLDAALQIPPALGGNDLSVALKRASEIMPKLGCNDVPLVFVISDGIEPVTPSMHEAIGMLPPCSVHMLLVDRSHGCNDAMEKDWTTVAFGSFTRLPHLDTQAMALTLADIYAESLGLSVGPMSAAK